jgi:hypothetical protein
VSNEQGSDPTAPQVHRQPIQNRRQENGVPVSEQTRSSSAKRARNPAAPKRQPQRAARAMQNRASGGVVTCLIARYRSLRIALGKPPISRQGARAQRAPAPAASCVQEEMAEQRFSVPSAPTKTAATKRTSQRAERAIKHSAKRPQINALLCATARPARESGGPAEQTRTRCRTPTTRLPVERPPDRRR